LMNVQPNILFAVHWGCSFCRWSCERWQPTPKGAPFYNAITSTSRGPSTKPNLLRTS